MGFLDDLMNNAGRAGDAAFAGPDARDAALERAEQISDFARSQGFRMGAADPGFARAHPDLATEAQDIYTSLSNVQTSSGALTSGAGALTSAAAARGLAPPRALPPGAPPQSGMPLPQAPSGGQVPNVASTVPGSGARPYSPAAPSAGDGAPPPSPSSPGPGVHVPRQALPAPAPGMLPAAAAARSGRGLPGMIAAGAGAALAAGGLAAGLTDPSMRSAASVNGTARPSGWHGPELQEADNEAARIKKEEEKAYLSVRVADLLPGV